MYFRRVVAEVEWIFDELTIRTALVLRRSMNGVVAYDGAGMTIYFEQKTDTLSSGTGLASTERRASGKVPTQSDLFLKPRSSRIPPSSHSLDYKRKEDKKPPEKMRINAFLLTSFNVCRALAHFRASITHLLNDYDREILLSRLSLVGFLLRSLPEFSTPDILFQVKRVQWDFDHIDVDECVRQCGVS